MSDTVANTVLIVGMTIAMTMIAVGTIASMVVGK